MTDPSLAALRAFRFRPSDGRLACQAASKVITTSRRLLYAAFRCPAGLTGVQVQRAVHAHSGRCGGFACLCVEAFRFQALGTVGGNVAIARATLADCVSCNLHLKASNATGLCNLASLAGL